MDPFDLQKISVGFPIGLVGISIERLFNIWNMKSAMVIDLTGISKKKKHPTKEIPKAIPA